MGQLKVSDNAATTLAASLTSSPAVTNMTLADASKFPVVNHGGSGTDWSYATLYDAANNLEIVKVTRRDNASNILTIVRGTAAGISGVTDANCRVWASGVTGVACRMTANAFNDIAASAATATAEAAAASASAGAAAASAALALPLTGGTISGNLAVAGGVSVGTGAGAEGGQIDFAKPASGTSMTSNLSLDVGGDALRAFATYAGGDRVAQLEFNRMQAGNQKVITFPAGTRMLFAQAAAPVGWTQDVSDTANNRMLRVVSSAGGTGGGSHSPILNNVVPSHTHGVTVYATDTNHTHGFQTDWEADHAHGYTIRTPVYNSQGWNQVYSAVADGASDSGATTGGAGGHDHYGTTGYKNQNASHTHSAVTDGGSIGANWTPRYLDMIICTKG